MKTNKYKKFFSLVAALALFALSSNLAIGQRIKNVNRYIEGASNPVFVSGNPDCADLNGDNASFPTITSDFGFKIDPPASGTFTLTSTDGELTGSAPEDTNNSVTTDIQSVALGQILNWSATLGVDAVIMKGGPNANVYVYNPEATSDQGIHTPVNPNNNKYFGISHIEFCYDYEAALKIIKDTPVENPQDFTFTASGAGATSNSIPNFTLDNDSLDNTHPNMISFNITNTGPANEITITEDAVPNWRIRPGTGISCSQTGPGSMANNTIDIPNRTVTVIVEPNETVTCTFVNQITLSTAAGAAISGRIINSSGRGLKDITIIATAFSNGESFHAAPDSYGKFRFSGLPVGDSYLVRVKSRYFKFEPDSQVVTLNSDFTDLEFVTVSPKQTRRGNED